MTPGWATRSPPEWLAEPGDGAPGGPPDQPPTLFPCPALSRPESGRKARDLPETQGQGPVAEEAPGSCPWWRGAWARVAAGSHPSFPLHPGCARPPAPARSLSLSLSRPTAGTERVAPGSPAPGRGGSQALAHTSKGPSKGSSHLWAALAAGSWTRDRTSGSWQRLAMGSGGRRGALRASPRLGTWAHARSAFLGGTCAPRVRPLRKVSGPRSRSRARWRPGLRSAGSLPGLPT